MPRRRSPALNTPLRASALLIAASLASGCGAPPAAAALLRDESFVEIAHPQDAAAVKSAMTHALQAADLPVRPGDSAETFYLAIHRKELGQRWFLAAFLKQYFPGAVAAGAARSLGNRVVSFRIQNGRLFVFDVDDRKVTSDTFAPEVIVEAWPIVDYAPFRDLPGAERYVLVDPSAGLNRFGVVADIFNTSSPLSRLTVELSYLQRFRRLDDGVAFEQLLVGAAEPGDPRNLLPGEPNPLRAAGTLAIGLRRYQEGTDYKATELPPREHYFRSAPILVPNAGRTRQVAARWAVKPGMKPIRWLMSNQFAEVQQAMPGFDIVGAVKAGVEGWNKVFGFPVLEAVLAAPGDSFADDDVNYIIFDKDPSYGAAYANWRMNPNSGEIRGASVYFNASWVSGAISRFVDDPKGLAAPRPRPQAPSLTWDGMAESRLCVLFSPEFEPRIVDDRPGDDAPDGNESELTKRQKVQQYISHVIAHEIGHTLGLRHNFKGSLAPPSSSVMEYMSDDDRIATAEPGRYDTEAVRFLYGLSDQLPSQPFCTDDDTNYDVDCMRFDRGVDPLTHFHGPTYTGFLSDYLEGRSGAQPNNSLNNVLKYVRSAPRAETRLAAWSMVIDQLKVPLSSDKGQGARDYAARVDEQGRRVLQRLYLDGYGSRGDFISDPPASDLVLQRAIVREAQLQLVNRDRIRSFATRRVDVDLLKKLQTLEAFDALTDARATIMQERMNLAGSEARLTDDLLARLDAALHPYFTN